MRVQTGEMTGVTAQAGRLAAQFAQKTTERLTHRRPGAAAWEIRLAVRRGLAGALPQVAASLARLRNGSPGGDIRQVGLPLPIASPDAIVLRAKTPPHGAVPSRPTAAARNSPSWQHSLPPQIPHAFSPAKMPRASSPAKMPPLSLVPHAMMRPHPAAAAVPAGAAPVSALPPGAAHPASPPAGRSVAGSPTPAALRERLVRESGLGETPALRLRQKLTPHLKFDPAMARLHRGAAAAAAARALDAEAFTIGPDVFFAAGRYAPETRAGLGLLVHELTHVGQQAALASGRMRFFTPQGGDALESEAQETAARTVEADDREKTSHTGGALHQTAAPPRPELAFALPPAQTFSATPAQKATEESGQPGAKVDPAQADARAVTDRVYEIMKREIALGRERGASRRRG